MNINLQDNPGLIKSLDISQLKRNISDGSVDAGGAEQTAFVNINSKKPYLKIGRVGEGAESFIVYDRYRFQLLSLDPSSELISK